MLLEQKRFLAAIILLKGIFMREIPNKLCSLNGISATLNAWPSCRRALPRMRYFHAVCVHRTSVWSQLEHQFARCIAKWRKLVKPKAQLEVTNGDKHRFGVRPSYWRRRKTSPSKRILPTNARCDIAQFLLPPYCPRPNATLPCNLWRAMALLPILRAKIWLELGKPYLAIEDQTRPGRPSIK